ncbi:hypothetical protein Slin15195_G014210 [Septoria linicola]|uniref:Rhodopsin domain-containing protein n=1 Tax=Septoria linicola TaxID=215465 RepID=A0A9Q9AL90_9PEZI|nr:hypothetical protein Slin15195_G014210 [Septoria linicola]
MPRREGYQNAVSFTISLCMVFTICVAIIRFWIRKHAYGVDDAIIGAATIISLGQLGASYASYAAGLGKPWSRIADEHNLQMLHEASVASLVLFFIALYLSKCAMISFLIRITKAPTQIKLYHVCNGVVAVIGLVSIIVVIAGCPSTSGYYWAFHLNADSCSSQDIRWQVATVLDCVTEVFHLGLPVHLVWALHMRSTKKAMIVAAFWVRLPILGFSVARNHYTLQLRRQQSDAGLDSALATIWLEIELAFAIAASTLSALKTFTESFNTGFGVGQLRGKAEDSYGLSDVSKSSGRGEKTEIASSRVAEAHRSELPLVDCRSHGPMFMQDSQLGLRLRPEELKSTTDIRAEPAASSFETGSVGSNNSDDMVIMRACDVQIQHDQAPILPLESRTRR